MVSRTEYYDYQVNTDGVPFQGLTIPQLREEGRRLHARGWSYLRRNQLIDAVVEANRLHQLESRRREEHRERILLLNRVNRNFPWYVGNNITEFAIERLPSRVPSWSETQEEHYSTTPTHILRFLAQREGYNADAMNRQQLLTYLMRIIPEDL